MPATMAGNRKLKNKQIKNELLKEINFLKSIFSVMSLPMQKKGDVNQDFEMVSNSKENEDKELPKRARSIAELEEKLEKMRSQNNFNLKNKLVKKSLSSKLSKKIKKRERVKANKTRVKGPSISANGEETIEKAEEKPNVSLAKPVFNTDGKLVFSKFDFAKVGKAEKKKESRDPKKILENMKQQEQKFQQLAETGDMDKVKVMKEKILWRNTLQKAEGQKIKDDPTLLKKSIKKQDQKKKVSKKMWDSRIKNVEQKKEDRQKKRKENIKKKQKEKKTKVIKAATKRGRVVI